MRRRKTSENEWQTVLGSSVISLKCSLVGTKTISGLPRPGLHSSGTTREDFKRRPANSLKGMARLCRLLLLMGVLLCLSAQLAGGQHWSHGWYPGGKRDLDLYDTSEVSEEIKLCEAGKCSYLRPQGRNILKTLLLDALIRDTFQKRK